MTTTSDNNATVTALVRAHGYAWLRSKDGTATRLSAQPTSSCHGGGIRS